MIINSGKLKDLFDRYIEELEKNNIKYAVIGNYEELPDYTENDIDFYVSHYALAEKILYGVAGEIDLKLYLTNKTAVGSNNYFYFYDGNHVEIIKIDLMIETAWLSVVPIIHGETIENNLVKYRGFYVVNRELESCMHLLYPLVTFNIVKDKYKDKLYAMSQNKLFIFNLNQVLGSAVADEMLNLLSEKRWGDLEQSSGKIKKKLLSNFCLELLKWNRLKAVFKFAKSAVKRFFDQNGVLVSFTGIDGAGKTTIKDRLVLDGEKYFVKGKTKQFYWRPFLLPRLAALFKKQNGEHEEYDISGKRVYKRSFKNRLFSYIKYFYYVSDFILGRVLYLKSIKTGGLAVFDRYHLDNIIYPERFGFSVNQTLMRWVDKWCIPQPDIVFYLSADSKKLYERKKELSVDEIDMQKKLYQAEMKYNEQIVEVNTSKDIESTYKEIILLCLETMAKRYK